MIDRVCSPKGAATGCLLALMIAGPHGISAQDTDNLVQARVRVVIPDSTPAFDPDVADKHEGAVLPWALVFPEAIGEEDLAVILLNPRYARLSTYISALTVLSEALAEGTTEIIVVRHPKEDTSRSPAASARAAELRQLTTSEHVPLPRMRGSGRVIEVVLTYAPKGQ